MKYWKRLLFILYFILRAGSVSAASISSLDSGRLFFIGAMAHYGSIVTDSKLLKPIAQSHPVMLQVDFSFIPNTQRSWNQCTCYSKTGLTLSYVDFKNAEVLGQAVNLSIFAEPYLYYSPRFQFSLRGGAGFSYLNNVYDSVTNPENLFVSSPISFLIHLGITTTYSISPSSNIHLSAQMSHISNGGGRYPNWGINFPTLALGITYQMNNQSITIRNNPTPINRTAKLIMRTYAGRHLAIGERRIVGGFNWGLIKPLSRINGLGVGGEIVYDAINEVLENYTGNEYKIIWASASLQHYFFFGKLLFGQQLAYAIIPPTSDDANKVYQLYTLEYHIAKQWYAGVTLKAHGDISDYLALSLSKEIKLN